MENDNADSGPPSTPSGRERGSTILRVLDLLERIAGSSQPVTAAELNRSLQLPKSTAHRLCTVMDEQGYLQKHIDGKRYVPGPRLHALAVGVLDHSDLRAQRHAIMTALSREVGETCNLTYRDGQGMVYAERIETKWPLRMQLPVGTRVPLHCTASGKMYLSTLPRKKCEIFIDCLERHPYTPNTLIDGKLLLNDLVKIRKQKYAEDREEFVPGMIALAVPIKDRRKRFLGTVAFHAPTSRMQREDALKFLPRMRLAAQQLVALVDQKEDRGISDGC